MSSEKMKEYTVAAAENLHRMRYKNQKEEHKFERSTVDLTGIVDGRTYVA